MMVGGPAMYFFNHEEVSATFARLGYPTYLIYPIAVAKLLGLVAIWTRRVETLKNLAYAGYFYDFMLSFFAHTMVADGEFAPSLVATVLVSVSYYSGENLPEGSS
ncbi:MAG: DoxX family protein [Deltaproteobacteria bacterium]|nr:DoxX family protein [Deltaproteobacteria bacterium]MBW2385749.1 DoxX family protein [Deltaproteobacteria bacterium]